MDDSVTVQEATTDSQAIPSYRPDAKTRRYDRQLRLWASSGQKSLESARVLVIGADATACQSLKNLVLPGISRFTILSPAIAAAADIATNFFLVPESFGSSMAEEACMLLKELNPGVEGTFAHEDPLELIKTSPEYFLNFTMILGVNLQPGFEMDLSDLLWEASNDPKRSPDIPLITVRNSGFIGSMRTQYREHCIVDTHPDNLHDLRIDSPFPALVEYAVGLDMEKMDSMEHSHVPYVVLMIRALEEWKREHEGKLPVYKEKKSFVELMTKSRRAADEENYQEAESQVFKASQKSKVPAGVQELFEDEQCTGVSKDSKNFWILIRALQEYTLHPSSSSLLPQSASLPDMKSSTTFYVALQNLYKTKAREDVEVFKQCLEKVLAEVGLGKDVIEEEEIEVFVKNCAYVTVCRGKSLRMSLETDVAGNTITSDLAGLASEMEATPTLSPALAYHVAFLASDLFFTKHGYWAGSDSSKTLEAETALLLVEAEACLGSLGWKGEVPEIVGDCVKEIARGGASTLPTTAAFLGGTVAQEAIKLVTGQYIPLNNTAIIDLIKGGINKYFL